MSTRPGVTYRPEASTVFAARDGCDIGRDGGDLAVLDRDVANRADPVLAVDDVAAFDDRS